MVAVKVKKIASKFRGRQGVASKFFYGRYKTSAFPDINDALKHQEKINRNLDEEIKTFISKHKSVFPTGILSGSLIKRQKTTIKEDGNYTEINKTVYFRTIPLNPKIKTAIFG